MASGIESLGIKKNRATGPGTPTGCVITVPVVCTCGNGKPIMVVWAPGLDLTATCDMCGTGYKMANIEFDREKGGDLSLGVSTLIPRIVSPY